MTEKLIQKALRINFNSHNYIFCNAFYFENESDFLSFLPNGYCYEIEIKISRSDFKADFKKIKHKLHNTVNNSGGYYVRKLREIKQMDPDWGFCKAFPELVESQEYFQGRRWGTPPGVRLWGTKGHQIEFEKIELKKLPNKFFYAVPKGLISRDDVPDYAGLLYINEDLTVEKVKDGKFIHRELLDPKKLWNKVYYAYSRELHQKLNEL